MKKMFYPGTIAFLFFFISSVAFVNAADQESEEYVIKKGDTLWDISEDKLQDNFLWPKVWSINPQIKNPDLIYPGDKIKIPSKEVITPMVEVPEEPPKKPVEMPVIAEPEIPEEKPPVEPLIKEVPREYIVNKNLYISSGWISMEFPSIGEISNAPDERTIFGSDDIVYLKTNESLTVGDKFFALRDIKKVIHPETGKSLGRQIRVTGILEVIGTEDNIPKAQITTAFEDIQIGDGLMYYVETEPPFIPDTARTPDINGYIVESHMNLIMTGSGDIIYLDKGYNDGLEVGDIFSVFSRTSFKRTIGTIQVISLQPTTSAAIILKSQQEISIGDKWGNR